MVMTIKEKGAIIEVALFSELYQNAINLILCIEDLIYKPFAKIMENPVIETRVFYAVYNEYNATYGATKSNNKYQVYLGTTLNADEVAGVITTGIENFFEKDAFEKAYHLFWEALDNSGLMTKDGDGRYQALPTTSQEFQDYWQLQLDTYDSSRAKIADNIETWVNDVAILDLGNYYIEFF